MERILLEITSLCFQGKDKIIFSLTLYLATLLSIIITSISDLQPSAAIVNQLHGQ